MDWPPHAFRQVVPMPLHETAQTHHQRVSPSSRPSSVDSVPHLRSERWHHSSSTLRSFPMMTKPSSIHRDDIAVHHCPGYAPRSSIPTPSHPSVSPTGSMMLTLPPCRPSTNQQLSRFEIQCSLYWWTRPNSPRVQCTSLEMSQSPKPRQSYPRTVAWTPRQSVTSTLRCSPTPTSCLLRHCVPHESGHCSPIRLARDRSMSHSVIPLSPCWKHERCYWNCHRTSPGVIRFP
jgi:hypothetical protein